VHESEPEVLVRDIMSRPPITAKETDSVMAVSKTMARHNIGCVIIVDKTGKPIGIITERDIVQRVAAKNMLPSDVKIADTMSKPVISISPGIRVNDAAKRMNTSKIRRLAVIEDGKLVGVLTMKDILEVTPALIDLISEQSKVGGLGRSQAKSALSGYCDECETWSDQLIQREGVFICQDCSKDLATLEES
jgi:CBS domain-containing protein